MEFACSPRFSEFHPKSKDMPPKIGVSELPVVCTVSVCVLQILPPRQDVLHPGTAFRPPAIDPTQYMRYRRVLAISPTLLLITFLSQHHHCVLSNTTLLIHLGSLTGLFGKAIIKRLTIYLTSCLRIITAVLPSFCLTPHQL